MKATVDITDSLLNAARRLASRERSTLRALMEEGLRRVLDSRQPARAFRLRRRSFKGKGLHPEVAGKGWDAIRERAYGARGG